MTGKKAEGDQTAGDRFAGARRVDRWLGRIWKRIWGGFCILAGVVIAGDAIFGAVAGGTMHWAPLAFGLCMSGLGYAWLRRDQGLLQQLSEDPDPSPSRSRERP